MKSLLLAVLLLLGTSVAEAALPWKTVAELEKDITNSALGLCGPDQPLVKMQTTRDGVTYIILVAGEARRFVIAELGDDDIPKTLYIGRVEGNDLKVTLQRAFNEGDVKAGPCPLLYPREAERKP